MTDADEQQPDAAHADVGIVSALPMELAPFLDRCEKLRKYTGGEFVFRGGRYPSPVAPLPEGEGCGVRVAVVQGAHGFAKARRATQALIDAHTPSWVLAAGFAGALRPEMKVGHVVMADSIVDTHGQELTVDLQLSDQEQTGLYVGRLVTTDDLVRTVQEKHQLAETYNAIAVDMESLAVAQVCRETQTRFLAVRAISDDTSADLPPEILSVLGATGTMRLGAAVGAAWKRPASIKEMWKLREQAYKAADNLAAFLDGVVTQLYNAHH